MIATHLHDNTQALEGANNFIGHVCKRAPNIKLPTVSARLQIRRSVAADDTWDNKKWSLIRGDVETACRTCIHNSHEACVSFKEMIFKIVG